MEMLLDSRMTRHIAMTSCDVSTSARKGETHDYVEEILKD